MANDGVRLPSTVAVLAEVLSPGLEVRRVREVRDLKFDRRPATTGDLVGTPRSIERGTTNPSLGIARIARRQDRRSLNTLHGKDIAAPGLSDVRPSCSAGVQSCHGADDP